jgi:hypothetical protein
VRHGKPDTMASTEKPGAGTVEAPAAGARPRPPGEQRNPAGLVTTTGGCHRASTCCAADRLASNSASPKRHRPGRSTACSKSIRRRRLRALAVYSPSTSALHNRGLCSLPSVQTAAPPCRTLPLSAVGDADSAIALYHHVPRATELAYGQRRGSRSHTAGSCRLERLAGAKP